MGTYKVVLEIELDAENPLDAAKTAEQWVKDSKLQYYVQSCKDQKIYSVDLEEDEDSVIETNEYYPLIKR